MKFDPEKITLFAETDARGQGLPFGIKAKDRQRHMYVVGKTGMGKSTLLENMAIQDIQNGEGMAFIDPHGSAAEKLLDYVPEHRVKDVIYFAPFDLGHPIAFNVMEDVGPDKRHLVVSGLMSTFKKIWVDAWSARMEYILTNALLALIEYPDTTLLSVNRLFSDKHFRKRVVEYIQDPAVKAFWVDEFANYTERFAAEALPAIQNKVGQFTGNPLIRNIIGQPHSSFDIRKIMDEQKILIMNLSKGLVGETNANLLGSMLTTRIYLAAMSRADLPIHVMKTMPNFYFYVDEFQSFANATFANILSEARKYHLNLIIAHQYIEQMEEDVRNAVFGNVGTTVSFRVGPFDAEVLETVFAPRFTATDLVNLGFAQIYLTLMIDGIGSQPFSAKTLGPIEPPRISCKNMVLAASRQAYTKPRAEVEVIVQNLHATEQPEKAEKPEMKKENNSERASRNNRSGGSGDGARNGGSGEGNRHFGNSGPNNREERSRPDQRGDERRTRVPQNGDRANPLPPKENRDRVREQSGRPPAVKSPDELKNILKQIVAAEERAAAPKPSPVQSSPAGGAEKGGKDLELLKGNKEKSATENRGGDELAKPAHHEALKSVLARFTTPTSEEKPPSSPVPSPAKSPASPGVDPTVNDQVQRATPPPQPTAGSSLDRAALTRLAAETEAAFSALESPPNRSGDPVAPDPREVEKLLRATKHRSPFT